MTEQAVRSRCVAVDGPAGAGKSTLSRLLAEKLGLPCLESGASYRAFAVFVIDAGVDPRCGEDVVALLPSFSLELVEGRRMLVNGADFTSRLRTPQVDEVSSVTSTYPAVRERMVAWQRSFAESQGVVMEGRDIGTVVLPDAAAKFFVTASPEVRARRRVQQLVTQGREADYDDVLTAIRERDRRDSERKASPLRPAEDAVLVDTSEMGVQDALSVMLDRVGSAGFSLPGEETPQPDAR